MPAGLLIIPAGVVVGILAERAAFDWDDPRRWVPDLAVGLTFIGAATFAVSRRAGTGWLLAATGYAWFAGNFDSALVYLHRGPLVHVIVAYVGWRSRSRLEAVTIGVGYLTSVIAAVWDNDVASVVLVAGLVAVTAHGFRTATGRARVDRRTAVHAAALFALAVAGFSIVTRAVPSGDAREPMLLVYEAVLGAIAVLLAARLGAPTASAVTDLVVELGDAPSGTLRDALAAALGDPTVEIGYWTTDGSYRDDRGVRLVLPGPGSGRATTFIERESRPFAVLVHDASVLDEPTVAEAVARATKLSAANAALAAQVRGQLDALAASRRRLLLAADEQRRRLELRLHDGVERRIVALTGQLRLLSDGDGDHVRRARLHLAKTVDDLRDIAHGLHPRELDAGLRGALQALAERCPIEVELHVAPDLVTTDETATAVYYVCAEALANVVKHAAATIVTIHVAERLNRLVVNVADDGAGGADPSTGSGLRGLADRIEALGGRFTLSGAQGGGTRLAAELPLR